MRKGCWLILAAVVLIVLFDIFTEKTPQYFPQSRAFYDVQAYGKKLYVIGTDLEETGFMIFQFDSADLSLDTIYNVYQGNVHLYDLKLIPLFQTNKWLVTGEKGGLSFWALIDKNFTLQNIEFSECQIINAVPYKNGFALMLELNYKCSDQAPKFNYALMCYDTTGELLMKTLLYDTRFNVKKLLWVSDDCLRRLWISSKNNLKLVEHNALTGEFRIKMLLENGYSSAVFLTDTLFAIAFDDILYVYGQRSTQFYFKYKYTTFWHDYVPYFVKIKDSLLLMLLSDYSMKLWTVDVAPQAGSLLANEYYKDYDLPDVDYNGIEYLSDSRVVLVGKDDLESKAFMLVYQVR